MLAVIVAAVGCSSPYRERIRRPIDTSGWTPTGASEEGAGGPGNPGIDNPAEVVRGPDGSYPIDLATVLRLAGGQAIIVEMARAQAGIAASEEEIVLAQWFPVAGPRVAFTRIGGLVQGTEGDFVNVGKQNMFLGAGVEWRVNPAATWYAALAARRLTEAHVHQITATGHAVLREAARRYYALVQAHAKLEIARRTLKAAQELVVFATSRERLGVGLRSEVLRALARVRQTEGLIAKATRDGAIASVRLVELLMLKDDVRLVPGEATARRVAFVDPNTALTQLFERALGNRPDLAAARARVSAAEEAQNVADRAWLWPALAARGAGGAFGQNPGRFQDSETFYVGLEWQISPAIPSRQRRAESNRKLANLALTHAARQVRRDIQEALARIKAAEAEHAAATQEVAAAREALQLARVQFERGEGLLLAVLDLEAALVRAETAQADAVLDLNRGHYDLLFAVGGPAAR
ncbi:MAG: hypothetical protein CMJ83_21550 [Planctomycetes bacterium]|nr:hypothetical protein [Planctomycetota bacterium]